jgi:hypothetical protein
MSFNTDRASWLWPSLKIIDARNGTLLFRALCLSLAWLIAPAYAADKTDIAISALEFGGSVGKLLWISAQDQRAASLAEANRFTILAEQVKSQIDLGRSSSALISANFNIVATTLGYAAAIDPEPLSKGITGVAAWGAKKTGDGIGQLVIDTAQNQARAILAQGLKDSGISGRSAQDDPR